MTFVSARRLHADQRLPELTAFLSALYRHSPDEFEPTIQDLAVHVRGQSDPAAFENFVYQLLFSIDAPPDDLHAIGASLVDPEDWPASVNLGICYLNRGGKAVPIIERVLYSYTQQKAHKIIAQIYRYAVANGIADQFTYETRFNVSGALIALGDTKDAFDIYVACLPDAPDAEQRKSLISNITLLARGSNDPAMVAQVEALKGAMIDDYADPIGAPQGPDLIEFSSPQSRLEELAVASALLKNGFCVLRDACDRETLAEMKRRIESDPGIRFPASFDDQIFPLLDGLFRFDPLAIISRAMKKEAALDKDACVIRRVKVDNLESQTPFHQDISAFLKPVINIWTPLTPAGGAYPSLELVRLRVNEIEQTILKQGQYNQVEIEERYVMARYGDRLYQFEAAEPGDCVIFLGSTIHRSSNLRHATQERLSVEVRYAHAA